VSRSTPPDALRQAASQVVSAGERLWRTSPERRAAWLADAFSMLADPKHPLGQRARTEIPQSAGLSPEMVSWALTHALGVLRESGLSAFEHSVPKPHASAARVRPGQLLVLVLAGNVFTACARGTALPLLFGWPVLAKASSRDDVFPLLLECALGESDAQLAQAFRVVTFPGEEEARNAVLFEQADAVSAYGSDSTLNAIRAQLSATVSFIPHGHGLGAAFIGSAALANLSLAREVARGLALDVAAYDQRGCMSPLVAWVARDANVGLQQFGELVHAELSALSTSLPRGPLPMAVASAQLSWRGISAIRGSLLEGDGFAVACEDTGSLRLSPGHRNLQLLGVASIQALPHKLSPLGVHLKCLGVAGVSDLRSVLALLPARVAPRVCPVGSMQTPPLHALHDGVPAWEGLVRWSEI
jgi:hypothetical protein